MAQHDEQQRRDDDERIAPEDIPGKAGAEGGSKSPAADKLPAAPVRDESAFGDTDQHSTG